MNKEGGDNTTFYGKVYVDSRLNLKGQVSSPALNGRILLAKGTEVFYNKKEDLSLSESEKVITFITKTSLKEEGKLPLKTGPEKYSSASVETFLDIDPFTRMNFNLTQKLYNINLSIQGGGSLNYTMLGNNRMNLSGSYEIGEGTANVKMIGWPNKLFRITPGGFIRWDGNVEDPTLQFEALNRVSSSYTNPIDNKTRDVYFNVLLKLTGRLSELSVVFTINTPDQYLMSIINTLGPEEQMRQAITILLFEKIDLPGISTSTDYVTQQVSQILESQLNQITKTSIKGIDISFGIDTYVSGSQGGSQQEKTSLSYDVKKSVLNDRAKIQVSGRLNDYSNQQGNSNVSLNNFSFEYRLDSLATKFVKVYNERSYEDVFEGEVIKTGVGVTYRKSYPTLGDMFRRDEKKKKSKEPGR
jgi:translocation and assembly module TamB